MFLDILLEYMPRSRIIRKKEINIFKALETYQTVLPKRWHQSLFLAAVKERDSFNVSLTVLSLCFFKNLGYFECQKHLIALFCIFTIV